MSLLSSMAGPIAAAIATPLLIGLLSAAIGKGRPRNLEPGSGAISPEKISAAFTVAVGALMIIGGVWALMAGLWPVALILVVLGLCIGGFMAPSLTHLHDVSWSPEGLEGPSTQFGPTLGLKRELIGWVDIATLGTTKTSYWFAEAADGRRVHWSYLYKGHKALSDALQARRPDLFIASSEAL